MKNNTDLINSHSFLLTTKKKLYTLTFYFWYSELNSIFNYFKTRPQVPYMLLYTHVYKKIMQSILTMHTCIQYVFKNLK